MRALHVNCNGSYQGSCVRTQPNLTTPKSALKSSLSNSRSPAATKNNKSRNDSILSKSTGCVNSSNISVRSSSKKRKVAFKDVQVREMFTQIGESAVPCDGGPPLGISPKMKRTLVHNLDVFEFERSTGCRLKHSVGSPQLQRIGTERYAKEGRLPPWERSKMLVESTRVKSESIVQAAQAAARIQLNREVSNQEQEQEEQRVENELVQARDAGQDCTTEATRRFFSFENCSEKDIVAVDDNVDLLMDTIQFEIENGGRFVGVAELF